MKKNHSTWDRYLSALFWKIFSYLISTFNIISISTMEYYIKLMIIYAGFIIGGTCIFFYGLFHNWYETSKFAKTAMDPVGALLKINYQVKGAHFITKKTPYIIVCNHQHALDITSLMQIWHKFDKAAVTAKQELKWLGLFGLSLQLAGTIFIPRKNKAHAHLAVNKAIEKAKSENTSILVFPEGTRHMRSSDGISMLPFKKGAFHMALNAGLPILPIVISEYTFINDKKMIFGHIDSSKQSLDVTVNVLKPIETKDLSSFEINKLVEETRSKMISVFEKPIRRSLAEKLH